MNYTQEAEKWSEASAYERGRENRLWLEGNFSASQNANGRSQAFWEVAQHYRQLAEEEER